MRNSERLFVILTQQPHWNPHAHTLLWVHLLAGQVEWMQVDRSDSQRMCAKRAHEALTQYPLPRLRWVPTPLDNNEVERLPTEGYRTRQPAFSTRYGFSRMRFPPDPISNTTTVARLSVCVCVFIPARTVVTDIAVAAQSPMGCRAWQCGKSHRLRCWVPRCIAVTTIPHSPFDPSLNEKYKKALETNRICISRHCGLIIAIETIHLVFEYG